MRLSPLFLFLGSTLLSGVQAAEADKDERENTYFNSMKVPPILELTPDTFDKEVKASQFMLIKHYRYPIMLSLTRPLRNVLTME